MGLVEVPRCREAERHLFNEMPKQDNIQLVGRLSHGDDSTNVATCVISFLNVMLMSTKFRWDG